MTPYEIGVLLHYYCRAEDHEDIVRNPPIWRQTIDAFKQDGLIKQMHEEGRTYGLSERGEAYCKALTRMPLPVQVWVSPEAAAAVART